MSTRKWFYAAIGAGDLAVERARKAQSAFDFDWAKMRREFPRGLNEARGEFKKTADRALRDLSGRYRGLVERGENTYKNIRSSAPTKRAVEQTKTARTQTKTAGTSARKAAEATFEAAREAAAKVG